MDCILCLEEKKYWDTDKALPGLIDSLSFSFGVRDSSEESDSKHDIAHMTACNQ
jgi:hypothetical protein